MNIEFRIFETPYDRRNGRDLSWKWEVSYEVDNRIVEKTGHARSKAKAEEAAGAFMTQLKNEHQAEWKNDKVQWGNG